MTKVILVGIATLACLALAAPAFAQTQTSLSTLDQYGDPTYATEAEALRPENCGALGAEIVQTAAGLRYDCLREMDTVDDNLFDAYGNPTYATAAEGLEKCELHGVEAYGTRFQCVDELQDGDEEYVANDLRVYPTEAAAANSDDCAHLRPGEERLVAPYGDQGFTCEVQAGNTQ